MKFEGTFGGLSRLAEDEKRAEYQKINPHIPNSFNPTFKDRTRDCIPHQTALPTRRLG
ncbi:hypothetical protein J2W43_005432 [Pseudomonas brassicacearum]|jgi:hypothetical protein|uniref:Uncharacterized protein n=1 Tax=Pseudomonas brassicacearum TaxID=930166 RepID=A0AAW8MIB2_9PSED|nr:hypothetical protein [Pseudomonas brassicacearum]